MIDDYEARRTQAKGTKAFDKQRLIDAIERVSVATFDALWTDAAAALPARIDEAIWWEAWLTLRSASGEHLDEFRRLAARAGFTVSNRTLWFPERVVVQLHGTQQQWLDTPVLTGLLAELRGAKTTAEFFTSQTRAAQAAWTADLRGRLRVDLRGDDCVTLLDTGVNHGHPLLAHFVHDDDLHTVEPGWGVDDANGHGTELAGLALLGDLTDSLAGQAEVVVGHRLESVKILRHGGDPSWHSHRCAPSC